ncbi:MAG: type II toxin-antitoxin system VapC family toxin [Anaerolineae bacterium]|nr:type II toxin-antitoxin system VapC family toxin [Anaerolineae bacterium]
MIFDTDVFIWAQRGNVRAASLINNAVERFLSIQTFMELLQGTNDKNQQRLVKRFIADLGFQTLSLTETIGHRALVYIEEYGIASGLRAGDAIIAATAIENNMPLSSSNAKHFRIIRDLDLKVFRP